jgi:hypothetical protein
MTQFRNNLIAFLLAFCLGSAVVWIFAIRTQIVEPTGLQVPPINIPSSMAEAESKPAQIEPEVLTETNIESFVDSKRIGRPHRNKIEIRCFDRGDERVAEIKFYSRNRVGMWAQKQAVEFTKRDHLDCDPQIKDFNNDGLKDFTYQSDEAARGANEVRKLFIYDKKRDVLVYIRNSEDYPNLAYNKKLDCLDAWLFHATTTTVFLKLEGDRLREFAQVDTGLERTVTLIDNSGKSRVVYQKKMNPNNFGQVYRRFSSYNPPQ